MNLTDRIFTDVDAAREHLEATRWPRGAECPHCGVIGEATKLAGKAARPGTWQCNACREQFTVTVGTVFERSKVPLNKWLLATYLMASSKKGISAHQIGRTLGVTYKTAWFMCHRIREAMKPSDCGPFGRGGATVEVDETFIGTDTDVNTMGRRVRGGIMGLQMVVTLVERETGRSRSFVTDRLTINDVVPIVEANLHHEAHLMTDESKLYTSMGSGFASHRAVNHSQREYVSRDNNKVHTNTVEGFFNVFKRGMRGVYQHCGKQHLNRYLTEFDFRYSFRMALGVNDTMRADEALRGIGGKRLTYRRTNEARYA
jgi:transposase-like protein